MKKWMKGVLSHVREAWATAPAWLRTGITVTRVAWTLWRITELVASVLHAIPW